MLTSTYLPQTANPGHCTDETSQWLLRERNPNMAEKQSRKGHHALANSITLWISIYQYCQYEKSNEKFEKTGIWPVNRMVFSEETFCLLQQPLSAYACCHWWTVVTCRWTYPRFNWTFRTLYTSSVWIFFRSRESSTFWTNGQKLAPSYSVWNTHILRHTLRKTPPQVNHTSSCAKTPFPRVSPKEIIAVPQVEVK